MSGVFISYRREDSSGYAGRLFDILSARFGRENTYMDVDTIVGGDNFPQVIEGKIGVCDVVLAVIGERWLSCTAENGTRRLDMAGDFVRLEIAKAFERGVRVVPVLVGGATMPHEDELPGELRPLAVRESMDLRDAHFRADAERLIEALVETVPSLRKRPWKARSNRWLPSVALALAVAAVVVGVILSRQVKKPISRVNPDSPSQRSIAPDNTANPVVQAKPAVGDRHLTNDSLNVSGKWKATVRYWDETAYAETFNFEVDGAEISGTASYLGANRNIFDGKVEGNRISFMTKSLTALGDETYEDKHYYKGTVEDDTIRFSLLIDSRISETPPYHFTAKRFGVSDPTPPR